VRRDLKIDEGFGDGRQIGGDLMTDLEKSHLRIGAVTPEAACRSISYRSSSLLTDQLR
jgi:hypothetical protein